jgi:hypothetical protein
MMDHTTEHITESRRPWRPRVSGIVGAAFGPVAGAIVTFVNLRRFGASRKAGWVLVLTALASIPLGSLLSFLDKTAQPQDFLRLSGLVANLIIAVVYPSLQQREFEAWRARHPDIGTRNGWWATGWGVVGAAVFLGLAYLGAAPFVETVHDIDIAWRVESPISLGSEFSFEFRINNTAWTPQVLKSVSLDSDFLKSVRIVGSEPPFYRSDTQSPRGTTYYFDQQIPPRGALYVRFYALASQHGQLKPHYGICIKTGTNCAYYALTIAVE